jgi:heme exporter protein D
MHLIAPDILAEARGLSPGVLVTGVALGLLLWLFGWRWHRFWAVVAVTVAGGLYGLATGQAGGGHMLALGLLLAVSAGLLALELARLFAFAAGGTAVWLAAGALFPTAQELGIFFLAGGLVGVLFYRLWTMALTSFLGTVLAGHAGLVLISTLTEFDAIEWAGRNPIGLSVAVGLVSLLGLAAQGAQVRRVHVREEKQQQRRERKKRRDPIANGHLPPDLERLKEAFERPRDVA